MAAAPAGLDGKEVTELAEATRAGLDALWDQELGWYRPYDLRGRRSIGPATSSGLVALWAGVDQERVSRVIQRTGTWSRAVLRSIPTTDPSEESFDPIRYWRGPVWVLVNWLVADGLLRGGFPEQAAALRSDTRALVDDGFSEYFDPRSGSGIGGQSFSWTAALTLAWLTR
jgi:glycogen debranching enzyme